MFISVSDGSLLLCELLSHSGEWGLLSSCSEQASHCGGGFSCCGAVALGKGFSSCGAWVQLLWLPSSRAQAQ